MELLSSEVCSGVGVGHWEFTLSSQAGDEVVPQKMRGYLGSEYREQEKVLAGDSSVRLTYREEVRVLSVDGILAAVGR